MIKSSFFVHQFFKQDSFYKITLHIAGNSLYDAGMTILCSINHLSLHFGSKIIFNDAQLTINQRDRIGLLGMNGKGKSTLFNILKEEIVPDKTVPAFEFKKSRQDSGLGFSLFHLPQELPKLNLLTPDEKITLGSYFFYFYPELKVAYENALDEFDRLEGWQLLNEYESYLKYFGFHIFNRTDEESTDILEREIDIDQLSGGEQKKILLALGLSARKQLILWDEPTNHLDLETIELFEAELLQTDRAFILISHDRHLLSKLTNKIFHIEQGKIKDFTGSYTDYLTFLNDQEETRKRVLARLKNTLERETAWMRQGVKARGTRSKKRVDNFNELKSKVGEIKNNAKKTLDITLSHSNRQTKILSSGENISFAFDASKPLFKGLNFAINKGDKIGVLGKNGVGKSTLLKMILGDLQPTSGLLKTADGLRVQYCSQKREELLDHLTPYQLLGDGNDFVELPDGQKRHVISYFENFLFHRDDCHRPLHTFSGGEKSRLQLALNLTRQADILIFDEPTNDLDLETIDILEEKLRDYQGAILLISHDRSFLANVTNTIWHIHQNKCEQFRGGYEQVAPYLDALLLEEKIQQEQEQEIESDVKSEIKSEIKIEVEVAPVQIAPMVKAKPTSKYTEDELVSMIEKTEQKLQVIDDKLASFDFGQKNQEDMNKQLKILNDAREFLAKEVAAFYLELENLSSL